MGRAAALPESLVINSKVKLICKPARAVVLHTRTHTNGDLLIEASAMSKNKQPFVKQTSFSKVKTQQSSIQ